MQAHTLYNACDLRKQSIEDDSYCRKAFSIQQLYWRGRVDLTYDQQAEMTELLKSQLQKIRLDCKMKEREVRKVIDDWNCAADELGSSQNKLTTQRFCNLMKRASKLTSLMLSVFVGKLTQTSVNIICEKPPCKFAAVAMGSLAKGEATPYSDLEFMFLVERKSKATVKYFRLLAMTMYFLIGNLKETNLKYMNVRELKELNFNDRVKSGFKIDGLQTKAGNIPTGNGTPEQKDKFIVTVDQLLIEYKYILDNPDPEKSLKGDLTAMLAHTSVVYGDANLHQKFISGKSILVQNKERQSAQRKMLCQDLKDYNFLPTAVLDISFYTANLKSDIYRFPSILLHDLKLIYTIDSETSWQTLEELYKKRLLSKSWYENLEFLLASAQYARLATYLYHDSQCEEISFLRAINHTDGEKSSKKELWHIPDELCTQMGIHIIAARTNLYSADVLTILKSDLIFSNKQCAVYTHVSRANWGEAARILEEVIETTWTEGIASLLILCYFELQNWSKFKPLVAQKLEKIDKIKKQGQDKFVTSARLEQRIDMFAEVANFFLDEQHIDMLCLSAVGYTHEECFEYAEKQFLKLIEILPKNHWRSSTIYYDMARLYNDMEMYEKADELMKVGQGYDHIPPAMSSRPEGQKYVDAQRHYLQAIIALKRHEYSEAETSAKKSLQLYTDTYGDSQCVRIAWCYQILGMTHYERGETLQALNYHKEAVKILKPDPDFTPHDDVLSLEYYYMAKCYEGLGDLKKALPSYEKSVEIHRQLYEEGHEKNVLRIVGLGKMQYRFGMYADAVKNLQSALTVYEKIRKREHKKDLEEGKVLRYIALSYYALRDFNTSLKFLLRAVADFHILIELENPTFGQVMNE